MRSQSLLRVASIGIGIGDPFDDVWTPAKLGGPYLLTQNDAAAGVTYAAQPVPNNWDFETGDPPTGWLAVDATLSSQPGFEGQCIRVAKLVGNTPFCRQDLAPHVSGGRYIFSIRARSNGNGVPRMQNTSVNADGTNSTEWQKLDLEVTSTSAIIYLQSNAAAIGQYSEFDNLTVKNLSATTLNCLGSLGNFAQATAANMGWTSDPLAPTSIPRNGRRVLYFDGVADHYVNSIAASNHSYHKEDGFIFSRAYRPDNAVAGTDTLVDTCNATNTNHGVTVEYDAANQQIVVKVANGSGAFVISKATGANSCTKNAWHVVSVSWSEAAGVRILIDGAAAVTEASVGAASANDSTATLQDGRLSGNTNFLHGAVGDLYMRVGWVPDDSLLKTHNYMRRRYAI